MKIKLKYILLFICFIFTTSQVYAFDTEKLIINNSGAYVSDFSVNQLQQLCNEIECPDYLHEKFIIYPRLFVKNMPKDYAAIDNKTYRNELFIKILMPIVLKVNMEFQEEWENLLAIKYGFEDEKDFHPLDCEYIDILAAKYEIVTPYKDTRKYIMLLEELLLRAGPVPPSILVAAAAIYTDWGTSRIAIEANNLYKAKNWYSNEGLEPLSNDKDYRYKIYNSLEDSIRDYILKVNKSVNYRSFWHSRRVAQENKENFNEPVYGKRIDWSFVLDNNLGNYAGLLDYTLTYYRMYFLDIAELEEEYDFDN